MKNEVTIKRIGGGRFAIYVNGEVTTWEIINGSLGVSGTDRNMYGIVRPNGSVHWLGSLATCKKTIIFHLSKVVK